MYRRPVLYLTVVTLLLDAREACNATHADIDPLHGWKHWPLAGTLGHRVIDLSLFRTNHDRKIGACRVDYVDTASYR